MLLSGFFPQIVYTPLRELTNFTMEPRRRRLLGDAVPLIAEIDESDSKLFIWAQILHDFPFFSQF